MYAHLTPKMRRMLREYATDKDVYDLGAGDGVLTRNVARYAKTVVAVDTESPKTKATANILYVAATFKQFASTCMMQKHGADAVALLSWPANNASAMRTVLPLLECVSTVIYIGCSTDILGAPRTAPPVDHRTCSGTSSGEPCLKRSRVGVTRCSFSAHLAPPALRRAKKRRGLTTPASTRFKRSVEEV